MDLVLATRNEHKVREFRELLGAGFSLLDLSSFPEIVLPAETGSTFAENATLKAAAVAHHPEVRARHLLVVADDSGLEVDSLGGAPGIHSARYAGDVRQNIAKLLGEIRDRNVSQEERRARFRCVIALIVEGAPNEVFEGVVEGEIVDPPRGEGGFGYDPVFQPEGFDQTFGEMPPELKNKISHRARAISAMRSALGRRENQ